MAEETPDNSVGLVKPLFQRFDSSFELQSGEKLPGFELVYETYGQLNAKRNNASASASRAFGRPARCCDDVGILEEDSAAADCCASNCAKFTAAIKE